MLDVPGTFWSASLHEKGTGPKVTAGEWEDEAGNLVAGPWIPCSEPFPS